MTIYDFCKSEGLFSEQDGWVRLPLLVQGELRLPPAVSEASQGLVVSSGDRRYLLPNWSPREVFPEAPPLGLGRREVNTLLEGWSEILSREPDLVEMAALCAGDSGGLGREFTQQAFQDLARGIDPESALAMTGEEVGWEYLEAWQPLPFPPLESGATKALARGLFPGKFPSETPGDIRAFGTRQLHLCAGNAPGIPWITALRMALSVSNGVIKSSHQGLEAGSLLALIASFTPHPLTRGLSLVYWPGGDNRFEDLMFLPFRFDRIVVWGSGETVSEVAQKASHTRLVAFGPRYSVSFIGRSEAASQDSAELAASDTLVYNQHACNASLVHYVEGGMEQAVLWAEKLTLAFSVWDKAYPPPEDKAAWGDLKRLQLGMGRDLSWYPPVPDKARTTVVISPDPFDLLSHPGRRFVVIRPVATLEEALGFLSPGVSAVMVTPENRRRELRDELARRGVSSVLPLGQAERTVPGAPQDGMRVLSDLVDWKQG